MNNPEHPVLPEPTVRESMDPAKPDVVEVTFARPTALKGEDGMLKLGQEIVAHKSQIAEHIGASSGIER